MSVRAWLSLLLLTAGAAVFCPAVSFAQEDPEILVEVDRTTLFTGESIRYQVLLNHFSLDVEPSLTGFDDFEIKLVQKTQANSVVTRTNGFQRTTISRRGPVYLYELSPKRAGTFKIPAPTATTQGKEYSGEAIEINVTAPEEQDLVLVSLGYEPQRVYPMQPVTIKLELSVKTVEEGSEPIDPLQVQEMLPELRISWADDDKLPSGLVPHEPWERWLTPMMSSRGGGISINGIKQQRGPLENFFNDDPFQDFFPRDQFPSFRRSTRRSRDPRVGFLPPHEDIMQRDLTGRMVEYRQYSLRRKMTPERSGTFDLGQATVKGTFANAVSNGRLQGKTVYSVSPDLKLTVLEPPDEGRPASFTGAIGEFTVDARLMPTKVKVGDPMTLTLSLQGTGTLDATQPPEFDSNPEIVDQFKVYDATAETKGKRRVFIYSLRPKEEGTSEFPPIDIAYFDVHKEQYVSLQTPPIAIEVAAAQQLRTTDIAVAAKVSDSSGDLVAYSEGIFANVTDLDQICDESIQVDRYLASLTGLAGLFVVVVFVAQRAERWNKDSGLRQRRTAASRARTRLSETLDAVNANQPREAADRLCQTLICLIADAARKDESGITSEEARRMLADLGVSSDLVSRVERTLGGCDAIRYGASQDALTSLASDAKILLDDLIRAFQKKKLLS